MADHSEQIATLRDELATLRDEVASLHRDLRRAREHVDLTMRGQLRCRACGCRKIAHAMKVLDRADGSLREGMALYQPSWWSSKTRGELEAYACTRCGLVEWWVVDPKSLQPHDEFLRIIDGELAGPTDPYR
ncbi:MAG: hypothetical protein H0T89_06545 [Deltaproteobacteria bacterium]|nr:hypothetical protein [Deltaproteobacteria bacterium]MDQ3295360.1 hypothetical protein [Myxococcota bacterium]